MLTIRAFWTQNKLDWLKKLKKLKKSNLRFPTINGWNSNESLNGKGGVVTLKEKGSEGINRASAEGFDSHNYGPWAAGTSELQTRVL